MPAVTTTGELDPAATREQILHLIVGYGPITAAELSERLGITQAGIRRHLSAMEEAGDIVEHDVPSPGRGRGRPARHYVAATAAHQQLSSACSELAIQAMYYLATVAGHQAISDFAEERVVEFENHYGPILDQTVGGTRAKVEALALALDADGYAATSRPVPGTAAIQLCQGHCPIQQIAAEFPELCEAETAAISRLLGVHVQRLATLAGGEHVCTTNVPDIARATHSEGQRI